MRFIPIAAAAAAIPLLVTACSSLSPTSTHTSTPSTGAVTSAAADPNAGLLTGTQLKARLVPAARFPSGFTLDSGGSVDTGDTYQTPTPPAGPPDCTRLDATSWVDLAGVGGVSFAESDYVNKNTSEEYAQEIDVYRGTSAKDVMAGLRKLARTCPSFHDSQSSSTVTVTLHQGPPLGDDALTFTLESPRWQGATTLEAVRLGTAVISVLYSADSGTGTTDATNLTRAVTANLKSKG